MATCVIRAAIGLLLALCSINYAHNALADDLAAESPKAAFVKLQQAIINRDGEAAFELMSDEFVDDVLYAVWDDQIESVINCCWDFDQQRRLLRECLPTHVRQLPPLVRQCWKKKQAAVVLAVASSAECFDVLKVSRLVDVEMHGDVATASLKWHTADLTQGDDCAGVPVPPEEERSKTQVFIKTNDGWRLHIRPKEEAGEPPHSTPDAWSENPKPLYATPAAVEAAMKQAIDEHHYAAAWNCATPSLRAGFMRRDRVYFVERGILLWYLDGWKYARMEQQDELVVPRLAIPAMSTVRKSFSPTNVEEQIERNDYARSCLNDVRFVQSLYDSQAYYIALLKMYEENARRRGTLDEEIEASSLLVREDRAILTRQTRWADIETVSEIYFARRDGGWLLDIASPNEHLAKWRRDEIERRERLAKEDAGK